MVALKIIIKINFRSFFSNKNLMAQKPIAIAITCFNAAIVKIKSPEEINRKIEK